MSRARAGRQASVHRFTRFAPVLVAVATAVGISLSVATPAEAASGVHFGTIRYDSPGRDSRSNASINAEWAQVVNSGSRAVQLRNWSVRDLAGHRYVFRSFVLGAHRTVTLHSGKGTNNGAHVYWGQGGYVWNNTGDTAGLRTPSGARVDVCSWGDGSGQLSC